MFVNVCNVYVPISTATVTAPNLLPTCDRGGEKYMDGDFVPSGDVCSDCFCIDGEIICATLECAAPGPRCSPTTAPEDVCCPTAYDCGKK